MKRLYREDSYLKQCEASVLATVPAPGGQVDVQLDRTVFYPTGGGQPHDTGTLGPHPVVDVIEAGDGRVWHRVRLDGAPGEFDGEVVATIDWPRRFDHMQQHTGQHILSRAFLVTAEAATTSFHLGSRECTIDIAIDGVSDTLMRSVETLANTIIVSNAEVTVDRLPGEEAGRLMEDMDLVRELALAPGEPIRIVRVGSFDSTPCGGTHVRRSGEVGAIAIRSWERFKGGTRVTFFCGGRVVTELAGLGAIVDACGARLSSRSDELPGAVERLLSQLGDARRSGRELADSLIRLEAAAFDASARVIGSTRVVVETFADRDGDVIQALARAYVQTPGRVALLAAVDPGAPRSSVVFARSATGVPPGLRMNEILSAVCGTRGGRGGGSELLARGVITAAETSAALEEACTRLAERLAG